MIRLIPVAGIVASVVAGTIAVAAADSRVTTADVERVTGLHGVAVAGPPAPDIPRLSFADRNGRPLLVVAFFSAEEYGRAKTMRGVGSAGARANFHRDVPGIGDEAFDAPASEPTFALYVRKGANAFLLLSTLHEPGTAAARQPRVPARQLRALARIIVSRL